MTQAFHSQLNTWLLSLLALMVGGVLALMGWGLHAIFDMNGEMSASNAHVQAHTEQLTELKSDVKGLDDGQTKILVALEALKRQNSRP